MHQVTALKKSRWFGTIQRDFNRRDQRAIKFDGRSLLCFNDIEAMKVAQTNTAFALPRLMLADGTVDAIKWLALGLMTLDHVNKHLLHDAYGAFFAAGRLAVPLFGFVLAYNLARPGALENGVYRRVLKRLALFGAIATVPFAALGGLGWGWWPLNVLFMLFVSTACIYLLDKGGAGQRALFVVLFVLGGGLVEFWWPAVAMCVIAWAYCKRPSWWALIGWVASTAALYAINGNFWALAAFAIIFTSPHVDARMRRMKSFFYTYYPIHLAVIWALSTVV
jgi:hypothetical protein